MAQAQPAQWPVDHGQPIAAASGGRQEPAPAKAGADPNLFGSPAKRVALTAEHAAARSWPIDHSIRPNLVVL